MTHARTSQLIPVFHQAASAYLARPGVLSGLELSEIASQLKQAAASELRDDTLGGLLHRCLRAVRAGDLPEAQSLIEAIGEHLQGLETAPS